MLFFFHLVGPPYRNVHIYRKPNCLQVGLASPVRQKVTPVGATVPPISKRWTQLSTSGVGHPSCAEVRTVGASVP